MLRTCVCAALLFVCLPFICVAPVPKGENLQPRFAILKATLGKKHNGKEVRVLARTIGEDPVIHYSLWTIPIEWGDKGQDDVLFFLLWKEHGITLNVSEGVVSMVAIYNSKPEGYKRYKGEIPEGLKLDDDVELVRKKLGKPDEETELPPRQVKGSTKEWEEVWLEYSKKGLEVILRKPTGGKWAIDTIKVWMPSE